MGGPKVKFLSEKEFVKAKLDGPGCHRVVTCDMNSVSALQSKESIKREFLLNAGVVLIYNLCEVCCC